MTSLAVADNTLAWRTTEFASPASAPTIVSVSAGDGQVSITWAAPTDPGPGAVITGYLVGRDGTDSTGYGPWSTTVPATTFSNTFANLVNGTEYNLYVETVTNLGGGARVTLPVTPSGGAPPPVTAARQLGVYSNGFPGTGVNAFTAFENQLLGGADVLLSESFSKATFSGIQTLNGTIGSWNTWLSLGSGRRAVVAIGMIPEYGPTQAWTTKKGSDSEVSTALAAGAAGDYDSNWVTLGNNLTGGMANAIIRLGWEFNGGWYAHRAGPNPSAWVTYFRRIVNILRHGNAAGTGPVIRPGILIDWNASGSQFNNYLRNGNGANVGALDLAYPGDGYVDIVGVDMYDQHGSRTKADGWAQVTGPALQWWAQFAALHGKPMSIPEWGNWGAFKGSTRNTVDADNDTYINNMWAFIEANNVMYHVSWGTTDAADGNHRIITPPIAPSTDEFPTARAAFAAKTWRLTP